MRLVTVIEENKYFPAVVLDRKVSKLQDVLAETGITVPNTIEELIRNQRDVFPTIAKNIDSEAVYAHDESQVDLGPCISNPGKIICVGLNYREHAIESGMAIPEHPILFSKFNNAIAAHRQEINISGLVQVDYESELGVVIGKNARNVSTADAIDYVFGYCNANDLSERELQFRSGQWLLGKTIDGFLPLGPFLVTKDEVPDPQNLSVRGWLNGELRQDSTTADMIFTVAEIISYASKYFTLLPGDVIVTGTPFGVILGMEEKVWMRPGDEFTVEIGNLGRLTNRVI